MTPAEWQASTDLRAMLRYVLMRVRNSHAAVQRKSRLFAVACLRQPLAPATATGERMRASIEAAERYADRLASCEELDAAYLAAHSDWLAGAVIAHPGCSFWVAEQVTTFVTAELPEPWRDEVEAVHCRLVREIFRGPGYWLVGSWLTTPDAVRVARATYDERRAASGELDRLGLDALAARRSS
jgi:hypothetical protein